jgi:4-amino-4-deoxy-L-arabinose transferase-like glycosyltransferase
MATLNTAGWLAATLLLAVIAIAFGARVLRLFGISVPGTLERALLSVGVSFAALQLAVFALLAEGWLRRGTLGMLFGAMALAAGRDWKIFGELAAAARELFAEVRKSRLCFALAMGIAAVLLLDGVMAMAPLTGSDALHYHFTVPALLLRNGFDPLYGIITSFGIGQAHMLIAMGLALGSDHIALGLIFLGGAFSAASLYVLARKWISIERSLIVTLIFLLSPIAFWQMTVAGAPDIWMTFYTTAAVLAAARGITLRSMRWAALAGFLAGAAAGSKYPSWMIPATLAVVFLVECRSFWLAAISSLAAFSSGIWPLVRNAWWTGDPFFPYASKLFPPRTMNTYTLAEVVADTHKMAAHQTIVAWAEYPFRMVLDGANYGVGHYFGPLVLIFAPLLFFAYRPTPLFRSAAWVWAVMFVSNQYSSQMARFLLPVFAIALAITFAGVETVSKLDRPLIRLGCRISIGIFLLFGTASYAAYAKDFLPVSVGLESRERFLDRMAPNYQEISFVNRALEGKPGVTLVNFQHLYYLRVNFVVGDPTSNWLLYPKDFESSDAMLEWLRTNDIRWIVKVGEYPMALREVLGGLEAEGILRPVDSAQMEDFAGWRISEEKINVVMQIMEVRQPAP